MKRRVLRCSANLLLQCLPCVVRLDANVPRIALEGIYPSLAEGKATQVVIERARCQPKHELPLVIVESPDDIVGIREISHELRGLDIPGRGPEDRPGASEIAFGEERHGLVLNHGEAG